MKLRKMLIAASALALITACDMAPQTTTGADFTRGNYVDSNTRKASNVKPLLKFPAKFCIVKMSDGKMQPAQSRELEIWQSIAARNSALGTFTQINEMSVALVSSEGLGDRYRDASMADVRAAAARQHCHAILSYQVRKDSTGYVASGLLFDTRNGYTYLSGTSAAGNASEAVNRLATDFEKGLSALVIALR